MAIGEKQRLITTIVGTVLAEQAETNKKFHWFHNKHDKENFGKYFPTIDKIFGSLNGDVQASQTKRNICLDCDAFFGGQFNFIFEFDEFQHFSSSRLRAMESYPKDLRVNFSVKEWKALCQIHSARADNYRKAKATSDFNFVGGRTAQRAYLDCFRDLLPEIHGLSPTLRINEFEVDGITRIDKDACNRVEQLLKVKLS